MTGRLQFEGGIISVLSDHVLLNILERIPDRIDRQSWSMVCKHFLFLEASCRKDVQLLRSKVLSRILQRYNNLEHLDLSMCIRVDDESLQTVARLAGKRLLSIKLSNSRGFTNYGLAAIASDCVSLRDVDLSTCSQVGDSGISALGQLKHLQSLSLLRCRRISDIGLGCLAAGCKALRILNLRWCLGVTDTGIGYVAGSCTQLHSLDLSYTDVTVKGLSFIVPLKYLENLILVSCNSVNDAGLECLKNGCRSLQKLDVTGCLNVSSLGVMALANSSVPLQQLSLSYCLPITYELLASLRKFEELQGMKLDGCDIAGAGLELIGKGCKALKELSLSKCRGVTDAGMRGLVAGCTGMHKLDLTCCGELTDVTLVSIAAYCKGLLSLKMESCGHVTDAGLALIGNECPFLEELNLTDCNVTDSGLKSIARCTALRFLKLGFCLNITDSGLVFIGAGCTNLRDLDLYRSVGIGDAGVAAITSGCRRLRVLNLSYCARITDMSMQSLVQLRDLQQLEMRSCILVSSLGLSFVGAACKNMVELDIKRCINIGDPGIIAVAQGCPNLREINISYCSVTNEGFMAIARQNCIQNLKLMHLKHVTDDCYAPALLGCGSLKKLKLLTRLQMVIPGDVISQLQSRGCRIRWMEKPP